MRKSTYFAACGVFVMLSAASSGPLSAQNVSLPSNDWNGSWGFPSTSEKQLRLLQADLIEKKEEGYYESLGEINVTNNVTNDYSSGRVEVTAGDGSTVSIDNRTGDEIGQNTNVIGSVNASETRIDVSGSNNNVQAGNTASSNGCQNGSINVESPNSASTPTTCN